MLIRSIIRQKHAAREDGKVPHSFEAGYQSTHEGFVYHVFSLMEQSQSRNSLPILSRERECGCVPSKLESH